MSDLKLLFVALAAVVQWRAATPTAAHDQRLRESDIGARAPEAFVARLVLTNRRDRKPHEIDVWRAGPDRLLVRFLDAGERGRYLLRRGPDMWLLTPDAKQPVKLNPAYRVYSGVNLDEILGVRLERDYRLEAVEESPGDDGEPLTAFELRATGGALFPSLRHVVRNRDARPVRTEYRLVSGKAASVIEYREWSLQPALHARRFAVTDATAQRDDDRRRDRAAAGAAGARRALRSGRLERAPAARSGAAPGPLVPIALRRPEAAEAEPLMRALPDRPFDLGADVRDGGQHVAVAIRAAAHDNRRPHHRAEPEVAVEETEDRHDRHVGGAREEGRPHRQRHRLTEHRDGDVAPAGPRPIPLQGDDLASAERLHECEHEPGIFAGEVRHVVVAGPAQDAAHERLGPGVDLGLAHHVDAPGDAGHPFERGAFPRPDVRRDQHRAALGVAHAQPVLEAVHARGAAWGAGEPGVALRQAARELRHRGVGAPQPGHARGGTEHGVEIGGDGPPNPAQHQEEEGAEQQNAAAMRPQGQVRHAPVRKLVPEHARDMEAPEQALRQPDHGRVRRLDAARCGHGQAELPASTIRHCPVMAAARSESRNATAWATSRGDVPAGRHSWARSRATSGAARPAVMSVATKPGSTVLIADVAPPHLARQRARQAEERRLRGRVGRLPWAAGHRRERRHLHDGAAPAVHHRPEHGAATAEGAAEIDVERLVPVAIGGHRRQRGEGHAGVVDQAIDRPQRGLDRGGPRRRAPRARRGRARSACARPPLPSVTSRAAASSVR